MLESCSFPLRLLVIGTKQKILETSFICNKHQKYCPRLNIDLSPNIYGFFCGMFMLLIGRQLLRSIIKQIQNNEMYQQKHPLIIWCTCVPGSGALVSPLAILQAREPELRPPSSPGFGFLGEINSTSSTSSLSVSSFFLSGVRVCCLFNIRAEGTRQTSVYIRVYIENNWSHTQG